MNNISKILDAVSAEGKADAEKILENGKKNAQEVLKLYSEEASIEEAAILKKAQKEADEITQRSVSQAGIASRNIKLTARREALERTFSAALEKLSQLPEDRKQKLYSTFIQTYAVGTEVTVVLNKRDNQAFGKKLVQKVSQDHGITVKIEKEDGDFSGGFILREGEVETNCTFEVIIKDAKKEKESEIAAMLFA